GGRGAGFLGWRGGGGPRGGRRLAPRPRGGGLPPPQGRSLGTLVLVACSIIFAYPMAQSHHAAKKLTAAHCRIAEPFFARRHVGHNAAPRSDDGALADPHIIRETHLPGQDDTILDHDAAGDAALGNDEAMP